MQTPYWRSRALRRLRRPRYDYATPGTYFVTVVTANRRRILSEVVNGEVVHSALGEIVREAWRVLGSRHPVLAGPHVVMPDHVHGLLSLLPCEKPKTLGAVAGAFKAAVTRAAGWERGTLWQDQYHDRIVRSDEEERRIVEYIEANPARWLEDAGRLPGEEFAAFQERIRAEQEALRRRAQSKRK